MRELEAAAGPNRIGYPLPKKIVQEIPGARQRANCLDLSLKGICMEPLNSADLFRRQTSIRLPE